MGERERGTKAGQRKYKDGVIDECRKVASQQFACAYKNHAARPTHLVHTYEWTDGRLSRLIEIPSVALRRLLIGSLGGGEIGLQ